MEFNRWEGDLQELLKGLREKLNVLGEVKFLPFLETVRCCLLLAFSIYGNFWIYFLNYSIGLGMRRTNA